MADGVSKPGGLNNEVLWRASERSIQDSVRNALARARERSLSSLAFPLIGAGSGGFNAQRARPGPSIES